ncbi:AAA family ATPase [Bacillus cereus]|nr:AAA family ATPase [Bacillus cereus]MDA2080225.1 AAA family ATPase [Bacillus cereus]MDA2085746.1 AAA family ATPase [Bacillus cereus]
MFVEYIRIKNFRSILDSGNLYFDKNLTVLAGKNESGKSNIFKALECFSKDNLSVEDIPEFFYDNIPDNKNINPEVSVSLKITREEILNKLSASDKFYFKEETLNLFDTYNLLITRTAEERQFIKGSLFGLIFSDELKNIVSGLIDFSNSISGLESYLEESSSFLNEIKNRGNITSSNQVHYDLQVISYCAFEVKEKVAKIIKNVNSDDLKKQFNIIYQEVEGLELLADKLLDSFGELVNIFAPKFVLFDSFNDMLPDYVDNKQEDLPRIVQRFFNITKLSRDVLLNCKRDKRKRLTRRISSEINVDFKGFYSQDNARIEVDLDGDYLNFYVSDGNNNIQFKPSQRSQGFQWFLSFFLTLKAEINEGENYILLLDEPGLYLHAKAQNDVLKVLEALSISNQLLITTHSPYLIDSSRLERVRLVLKNELGNTYIENKIHKGADEYTLTPIITSIGADLGKDLVFSMNSVNVLVEGISDYYYLEALKKYINVSDGDIINFRFIPNVGATKIPNLAVLLIGWGLDFLVLLDNDTEGKRVEKTLLDKLLVNKNRIIFVNDVENNSIEDMFSKEDFNEFVLCEEKTGDIQDSNSKNIGTKKALLAKKFNEACHDPNFDLTLSQETINNFTELFTKLSFAISNDKVSSLNNS